MSAPAALPAALRAPLTDLFSRLSAIEQMGEALTPLMRQQLEGILLDGYRMLRTVESIPLAEHYTLTEPNRADFPLWGELCRCLGTACALLSHAGRLLEYEFPTEEATVRGDLHALVTVLLHLIANALTAAPPNEPVTVRGEVRGENAILTIQDRGHGIPAERLTDVFTPYFSLDANGLPLQSPGLGLAAARRILEAHGGSIRLVSDGGGTEVICTLPLRQGETPTLRAPVMQYGEDRFSPLYTVLCDFLPPPWPYEKG